MGPAWKVSVIRDDNDFDQHKITAEVLSEKWSSSDQGERRLRTAEARRAGCRLDRRREHADGRGLSGAVRSEQAEHLTRRDGEVDALHGLDAARVGLAQVLHVDSGGVVSNSSLHTSEDDVGSCGVTVPAACHIRRHCIVL